jgi:spore coat protein SA
MVDTPIRVCLVSPGLLPVPATQGGAIETLMTTLMRQNERFHRMDLTVISSDEPKARALAEEYRSTHVVFLQSPGLPYKVANRVRNLWNRKRRSRVSAYYAKALVEIKKAGPFDVVVIEGGPCDAMAPYEDYCGDALMYHLHYDPTTPFHSTGYSRVIAVSDYVANSWRRNCLDPVTDVRVAHNGIDVSKFQREFTEEDRETVRAQLGFTPDDFVALYCGRIIEVKGVLELLKAIQRIDDDHVKLMVVGSPDFAKSSRTPYLNKVQSLVDELGDRVAFTGYVPNDQVYRYSKSADVQVVPSLWEEAAGLVGVEAMAAGLPLIVSHSGGLQEYVPETCSIVVERNESFISSLSDVIVSLREHPELCESMMKNGLLQAEQFSEQTFYDEFVRAIGE